MSTGKVIRFDEFKGYGFVAPDGGGEDVFIHVNDFDFDKRLLAPGVVVEYVAEEGDRGLKASQIQIVDRPGGHSAPPAKPAHATAHTSTHAASHAPAHVDAGHEDVMCDVLSAREFSAELTETLLHADRTLTSAQILAVRESVIGVARSHKWLEG